MSMQMSTAKEGSLGVNPPTLMPSWPDTATSQTFNQGELQPASGAQYPERGLLPEELTYLLEGAQPWAEDDSDAVSGRCVTERAQAALGVQVAYYGHTAEISFQTGRYRPEDAELRDLLERQRLAHRLSAYQLAHLSAGVFWIYQNPTIVLTSRASWRADAI